MYANAYRAQYKYTKLLFDNPIISLLHLSNTKKQKQTNRLKIHKQLFTVEYWKYHACP